jgi:hypothetical protein
MKVVNQGYLDGIKAEVMMVLWGNHFKVNVAKDISGAGNKQY